ncbi:MAG: hypothetical protein PHE43_00330 [Candidatus Nanoarchaeia archaeon]|nr:hypothetical protein [Candidatus Nanoarchaeia archaeon]
MRKEEVKTFKVYMVPHGFVPDPKDPSKKGHFCYMGFSFNIETEEFHFDISSGFISEEKFQKIIRPIVWRIILMTIKEKDSKEHFEKFTKCLVPEIVAEIDADPEARLLFIELRKKFGEDYDSILSRDLGPGIFVENKMPIRVSEDKKNKL